MLSRLSIGTKIFGLAVLLLCITIGLTCFLLWRVTRLTEELSLISRREVPLAASLSRIDEFGLRRRLAFERWFGALNATRPNQEIIAEASANYSGFTERLNQEFDTAEKLLDIPVKNDSHRASLRQIQAVLAQIEAAYPLIASRQRQVLDLQVAGHHVRANDIINSLDDLQRLVQDQRQQLQNLSAALSQDAIDAATQNEKQVFWLSVAVTISAVLLGLLLSGFIAHRLVEPVRSLIAGIKSVEQGDLSVELPVLSRDEVGTLTQSFNFFVRELRSKEEIKRTFGQYIDPRVLEQAIFQPGAEAEGRRVMTVSFADLVGFTGLGEHLTASGLVNLLNRHFTLQAQAVQAQKGVIDKFIGDSVLSFWGPPFTLPEEHALLACRSGLQQLQALETLRLNLPELTGLRKHLPEVDLRIGISTGEVVVGNIGSESARSYTVIGDTVNLGQRLEAANRVYGTQILASEATCQAAGPAIVTREVDLIVVKGKTEPVRVFEVLGLKEDVPERRLRLGNQFALALEAYRSQAWDRSEADLNACLEISPNDGPARLFLDRLQVLRAQPPGEQWNGVWKMDTK